MFRRSIVAAALAAASWFLFAPFAHASWLAEIRGGAVGPVQGDLREALELGVGPAVGLTLSWETSANVAFDFRVDAMWMWGTATGGGFSGGHAYRFGTDSAMSTYALTMGPTLRSDLSGVELTLGVHPGLYLSTFDASDALRVLGDLDASNDIDSGTSIDFGFNAELGARLPVSDSFLVGAEVAYHFAFVRDLADDSFGALIGSLTVAWRG